MKRAGMGMVLAAVLLCGACSESKPAPAPGADGSATAMADAARAAVAATNANTSAVTAAASVAPTGAEPVNLLCPILGDPVDGTAGTVKYAGHTIGFCCRKCSAKFNLLDDKGKVAALAQHGTALK